jgi:Na+/proline symporter
MNWLLLAIVGYVLVQFVIGTWVSRRMASETDYILAGRGLGVAPVSRFLPRISGPRRCGLGRSRL